MRRDTTANSHVRRGILRLLVSSVGLALCGRHALGTEVYPESVVKAVFLYRFTGYVKWPPRVPPLAAFTLAVLGADPVGQELERILGNRKINGLPVRIKEIDSVEDLGDAQMLYIGSGSLDALQEEIAQIADRPVLVVTDNPDGLDAGSTLNFVLLDRRVRFEVSVMASDRAGLKVSAELLSVAARVKNDHRRSDDSCAPGATDEGRCSGRVRVGLDG
jgi:YfiR/HmsC-like